MSTTVLNQTSTALTNTSTDTAADAPVATDLHNLVVVEYNDRDKKGKVVRDVFADEDEANKVVTEGKGKILFHQAFSVSKAKTIDGVNSLCTSEENIVYFFNSGAIQRQKNRASAMLLEVDEQGDLTWQLTETPYSLAPVLNEDIRRRNLSDFEKAERQLSGLPDAVRKAIFEQLKKQIEG